MSDEIRFAVGGMTCASCVARVERVLCRQPGVEEASVNLATESAAVRFEPRETDVPGLLQAVTEAGYDPVRSRLELRVGGGRRGGLGTGYIFCGGGRRHGRPGSVCGRFGGGGVFLFGHSLVFLRSLFARSTGYGDQQQQHQ